MAPLPPVIFNAIIVGFEVACLADNGTFAFGNLSLAGFIAGAVSVGHRRAHRLLCARRAADDGAAPHEDQRTHVGVNLFRARPEKVGRSL